MHAFDEDYMFLCKCTAEIIAVAGIDPAAMMAGREAEFRSHRSCRRIDPIGRRIAAAVQVERTATPRLSRLAIAALRRDRKLNLAAA